MTHLIYIHGTGVREDACQSAFEVVSAKLNAISDRITPVRCYWGDKYGSSLGQNGASLPPTQPPDNSRVLGETLWTLLYQDALYELRLLKLKNTADEFLPRYPGEIVAERAQTPNLPAELLIACQEVGLTAAFEQARTSVPAEAEAEMLLKVVGESSAEALDTYRDLIARAVTARAIALTLESTGLAPTKQQRDEIVNVFQTKVLGGISLGPISWMRDALKGLAGWALLKEANWLGNYAAKNRTDVTTKASPPIGDILLYQARGQKLRHFIRDTVAQQPGPVILLGHSLGGIAAVEMLIEQEQEIAASPETKRLPVALLITVGSQSPLLYEMNALQTLPFGSALPERFPPWLNIYDKQDLLSYVGNGVFPDRVKDVGVANGQPFPEAHSAYWFNSETWDAVAQALQEVKL